MDHTLSGKTTVNGLLSENFTTGAHEQELEYCEEERLRVEEAKWRERERERLERECYGDGTPQEVFYESPQKVHYEERIRCESEHERRERENYNRERHYAHYHERRRDERITMLEDFEYRNHTSVAAFLASLPSGKALPPGVSAKDSIKETLARMDKADLLEVLTQMKVCNLIRIKFL